MTQLRFTFPVVHLFIGMLIQGIIFPAQAATEQDDFELGDSSVTIPWPEGFIRVTQAMPVEYKVFEMMHDPMNDDLAYFIPTPTEGQSPGVMDRYCIVKVSKELKEAKLNRADFDEIRQELKDNHAKLLKDAKGSIDDIMEFNSEALSSESQRDVSLTVEGITALGVHHESQDSISFNMAMNYATVVDGEEQIHRVISSTTFSNLGGKVVFFYIYGDHQDLPWVNDVAAKWIPQVLSSNPTPPQATQGLKSSFDWVSTLIGPLAGAMVALLFGLYSKRKIKQSETEA